MAPSSGHMLVPKAIKAFQYAVAQTTAIIRSKLPQPSTTAAAASLQPIPIRLTHQTVHPITLIRQSRLQNSSRGFGTAARHFSSFQSSARSRIPLPTSRVSRSVVRRGSAPFASALRPNLTGGCLARSAGGYSLGSGARSGIRYFSHVPAAQAQVVSNVSAAIRAFCLNGQKAHYDGIDARGNKKFRVASATQDKAFNVMSKAVTDKHVRGTTLEFCLSPTITALSPLAVGVQSLGSVSVLPGLAIDFARALKDLSATLADLKRLAVLGDLPVSLASASTLQVRFPGCDADTVSVLCDELGVQRGVIHEDQGWHGDKEVEMALLFPFAPSGSASEIGEVFLEQPQKETVDWKAMLSEHDRAGGLLPFSGKGQMSAEDVDFEAAHESWDDIEGYETLGSPLATQSPQRSGSAMDYEGVEGIYRFLAECDAARR